MVSGDGIDGGSDTVAVISTSEPPITISYDMSDYTFAENATDAAVYLVATLDAAYPRGPSRNYFVTFSTRFGTAKADEDYAPISERETFTRSEYGRDADADPFVARKLLSDFGFAIVDDAIYEGSERLDLVIEPDPTHVAGMAAFQKPDGTTCEPFGDCPNPLQYPVTITDEGDLPALLLSAVPASIAEEDDDGTTGTAENVSTVTVEITNGKTFAVDQTVTLTFSGTATQGTHYSVNPGDADPNTAGHQVVLRTGDSSVEVTVTATGNDTADRNRTVTVAADLDGTAIGSTDITILDDETTNTDATGQPLITGTARVGGKLTATKNTIADTDGLPVQFPDDYTFEWVRVDATDTETPIGTDSNNYTVLSADAGSTIRVNVSFTDGAGNSEGPLASAETAVVVANTAPTLVTPIPDQSAPIGTAFSYTFPTTTFSDADNDPLTYMATKADGTSLPAWLSFDPGTATFSGTPPVSVEIPLSLKVTASDGYGGSVSDMFAINAIRVPYAPTSLTATASGTTTINLSWTAPPNNGGSVITGYKIEVSSNGGTSWTDRVANTNSISTTYAHTGLAPGTTRHYRVSAINSVGTGAASNVDNATTDDATTTCLAPPLTGRMQIWTGTVTVGAYEDGGTVFLYGFGPSFGALDDTQFRVGTNDYTVDRAQLHASASTLAGRLEFSLTSALAAADSVGLTLHVCDASFAFADAEFNNTPHTYGWASAGLDWSSDTSRTLYLSVPRDTTSTDATLSALALSGVTLAPTFVSSTETYTATVGNAVMETTVTATPTHSGATVAFKDGDDNALTNPVTLAVGANVIKAVVTAEDTTTMKTYMVTVTREAITTNTCLAPTLTGRMQIWTGTVTVGANESGGTVYRYGFGPDYGALDFPQFSVGTNNYTVDRASVEASAATVPGRLVFSLTSELAAADRAQLTLHVCDAAFAFADAVLSDALYHYLWDEGLDWSSDTSRTLYLSVPRDTTSDDATLSALALSGVTLDPTFVSATQDYTATVVNAVMQTTVTATPTHAGATVAFKDGDDNALTNPVTLAVGANVIKAVVTAEDTTTMKTYMVTVTRETTTTSDDATLSALALSGVTFAPTFASATEDYTATVGNAVTEITVTATPTHAGATVAFKDGDNTALTSPVPLAVGATVIKAVVTAEDTTTMKTYMVTVTRATTTTVPGAPTSLTATASGTTTINLSWTAPADDGGSAITGYRIEVSPNGTSSWTNRVANTGTTTTTYAHTGLSAGTTRHYRVSAINATGTGAASSTDNATTGTTTDTGPLTLTVEAVEATVTEGEPVRYRIRMSRRTPGAVVQSSFRYKGNFVRNPNSVVTSGINSHGGRLSWVVSYDTLDDVVDEPNGKFTVTIGKPDSTLTGGADLYSHGEEYTVGSPSSATVTILDNDGDGVPPPPSPPIVSAEDARVEEGPGAELVFPVTLDRAPVETARIDWQTIDGANRTGATAGEDYVAASGTLEFRPGQTSKTIRVAVLDDSHDEGNEVMLLYLTGAENAVIDDALLKGTIENSDPLPRALMGRFGRTAALHVVERVEARMAAPRTVGVEGRVAGRQVRPGMERELALDVLRQLGASAGRPAPGAGGARSGVPMAAAAGSMALGAGMGRPASGALGLAAGPMDGRASPDGGLFDRGLASLGLGGGHLLTGSSIAVTRETRHGGLLSFWSRGARSSFAGREGALRLDGDVRTTMVGADYATGPLIVGVSLAHSRGRGGYTGVDIGEVHSSVTGLYPWLGYTVSDRVSVWGVTGYGTGTLALTPGEAPALTSGLSMGMAAGGLRGDLAESVVAGFGLAFKADALWVGTAIDGVAGPGGNLAATEAAVTRVRTGLEASRGYRFQRRVSLTPSVEVGLRHDGGDAERGAGLDVGAGVIVSDTSTGLAVDVRVRMLLVHQAEGFRERGASVSLSYNPTPSTPLGLTARVAPSWGGQATSGAEALWGRETMAGLAPGAGAHGTRLAAEVGYGLPVSRRFVGTPTFGVGTSESGRDYRLGYRLGALGGAGTTVELGVEAQRRERSRQAGTDHGARARATLRW